MPDVRQRLRHHIDTAAPPIDVAALSRRLAEEEMRRAVQTTLTKPTRTPVPPPTKRSAVLVFAAAAVLIVAAVGGFILLIGGDDEQQPVATTAAPGTTTTFGQPTTTALVTTTSTPPDTTTTTITEAPYDTLDPPLGVPPRPGPESGDTLTLTDLRSLYVASRSSLSAVTDLTFGDVVPLFGDGVRVRLLGGGEMEPEELTRGGRPHIIVVWGIGADIDDGSLDDLRYHLDWLELTRRSYDGTFGVMSVLLDGSDAEAAQNLVESRGYRFPTALGTPGTWGIESVEVTPMWLLLDESGALISGFFAFHTNPLPHGFMISELLDEGLPIVRFDEGTGLLSDCSPRLRAGLDESLWSASACGVQMLVGLEWQTVLEYEETVEVDLEVSRDGIWVGAGETTYLFNGEEWTIVAPAGSLAIAPDGTAWSLLDGVLRTYDGGDWQQVAVADADLVEGAPDGGAMAVDGDGTVYVAAESALWRYDGAGWTPLSNGIGEPGSPEHLPSMPSPWLAVGPDGSVWFHNGGDNGLGRYLDGDWRTYASPSPEHVAFAADGTVWVADNVVGAVAVRPDGSVDRYGLAHGLPTVALTDVAITADGTIWFSTIDKGVFAIVLD